MKPPLQYLIGGIFATIGLGQLLGSLYIYQTQKQFLANAYKAVGVVQELQYSRSRKGGGVYYPIVSFQTIEGQSHSFRSDSGTNPPAYEVGERVEVLYNRQRPSQAKLTGFWNLWGVMSILAGIGTLFAAIGFGVIFAQIQRKRQVARLKSIGTPLMLNSRVEYSTNKGKRLYYLRAEWLNPHDNKMYIFDSEKLPYDPTRFAQEPIRVWIDPQNPKQYYVDISALPSVA